MFRPLLRAGLFFLATLPAIAAPFSLAEYYAEPTDLPFDEDILEKGTEPGWHWTEFRFTSLIYQGEPIRVRALFAVPDSANAQNQVPLILATHGKFGFLRPMTPDGKTDPRYWTAVSDFVKAGYAVMFFEWEPTFAIKAESPLPEHPRFTTYGKLDFSKEWRLPGNDFKDSLYYQVMMAGKRALTWALRQPEVDPSKVGVWGASFGGIFSSLLAAIDPRIQAANPVVFTARFGKTEDSYNRLPATWTDEQVEAFRDRFDSERLLPPRGSLPILYSVSTNDKPFSVIKACEIFPSMPTPRHLAIGPNLSHNDWNFSQTLRFFDYYLRKQGTRPEFGALTVRSEGGDVLARIPTNGSAVDFYYTPETPAGTPERDQKHPSSWTWLKVPGVGGPDGTFQAKWKAAVPQVRAFAIVKNPEGVTESTPIQTLKLASPPEIR